MSCSREKQTNGEGCCKEKEKMGKTSNNWCSTKRSFEEVADRVAAEIERAATRL